MLNDFERKLHRIIINFQRMKKSSPSYDEFMRLTGKSKGDISKTLQELSSQGYIHWSNGDIRTIQTLKEEDNKPINIRTSIELWMR